MSAINKTSMEIIPDHQQQNNSKTNQYGEQRLNVMENQRKGGLKSQQDRKYSQKRIQATNDNKSSTTKNIQFKNSKQFQKFIYARESLQQRLSQNEQQPKGKGIEESMKVQMKDNQCCMIM